MIAGRKSDRRLSAEKKEVGSGRKEKVQRDARVSSRIPSPYNFLLWNSVDTSRSGTSLSSALATFMLRLATPLRLYFSLYLSDCYGSHLFSCPLERSSFLPCSLVRETTVFSRRILRYRDIFRYTYSVMEEKRLLVYLNWSWK